MDRSQLKSMGVAAPGYGNARFLDEGDDIEADAVMFGRLGGGWTVFATDEAAAPIEATRRSFASDSDAFAYMYQCLRDRVAARRATTVAATEQAAVEARQNRPTLVDSYREMGVTGLATTVAWIATALGWLWISPFTYTLADTWKVGVTGSDWGEYIFPADRGVWVVAICYGVAAVNMAEQWSLGRHDDGRLGRRALPTAIGTALFSAVALVCMTIRSDEIDNALFWLPPLAALAASLTVALALFARRQQAGSAGD